MCGILFSSRRIQNLEKTIKFLKKRGPDHTEHLILSNIYIQKAKMLIKDEKRVYNG